MTTTDLNIDLPGLAVTDFLLTPALAVVALASTAPTAACPLCGAASGRVHSLIVADYFDMLQAELAGEAYNKAGHRAASSPGGQIGPLRRVQTPEHQCRTGRRRPPVHQRLQAAGELPGPSGPASRDFPDHPPGVPGPVGRRPGHLTRDGSGHYLPRPRPAVRRPAGPHHPA